MADLDPNKPISMTLTANEWSLVTAALVSTRVEEYIDLSRKVINHVTKEL